MFSLFKSQVTLKTTSYLKDSYSSLQPMKK